MIESIHFFSEDISFEPDNPNALKAWIVNCVSDTPYSIENINYIFCSDQYLYEINLEHLNHDTFTDIITFDLSESEHQLESDIFISIERVKENSNKLNIHFQDELCRVLIHGVLHLMGYKDKTPEQKEAMRKKEDACLSLRQF